MVGSMVGKKWAVEEEGEQQERDALLEREDRREGGEGKTRKGEGEEREKCVTSAQPCGGS